MTREAAQEKRALIIGGLSTSLINFRWPLIRGLAASGYKVFGCAAEEDPIVRDKFRQIGGEYLCAPIARTSLNPIHDIKAYQALKKIIKNIQPEIVIAYTIKPIVYGLPAAHQSGVKKTFALITGLGYAFTERNSSLKRAAVNLVAKILYKRGLKNATHVFFQNHDDPRVFEQLSILRPDQSYSTINGSGVDTLFFPTTPLPSTPTFLLIARLVADKGIREYAEAAKLIKKQFPDAIFYIAGPLDSNPSAISRTELEDWQQQNVLTYLGSLNDVRPAISNIRIYVLPSYREGLPRTILEAMAMGRAIITTDVPGCRETVIPGYNGILVPAKDIPRLAEAMKYAILNPKQISLYGKHSRQLATQKFDSAFVTRQMLEKIL